MESLKSGNTQGDRYLIDSHNVCRLLNLLAEVSNPPITVDTTWPLVKPQIWGNVSYQALPEKRRRALFDKFYAAVLTAADTAAQVAADRIVAAAAAASADEAAAASAAMSEIKYLESKAAQLRQSSLTVEQMSAAAAELSAAMDFSNEEVEGLILQGLVVGEESVARGVFLSREATGRQMTVAEQVEAIMAAQEAARRDGGDNEKMEEMMRVQVRAWNWRNQGRVVCQGGGRDRERDSLALRGRGKHRNQCLSRAVPFATLVQAPSFPASQLYKTSYYGLLRLCVMCGMIPGTMKIAFATHHESGARYNIQDLAAACLISSQTEWVSQTVLVQFLCGQSSMK